jgi:hypothetical protein
MTTVEPPESPAQAITPGRVVQVPWPGTPTDVPDPTVDITATADFVQILGRMADVWARLMVNMHNRRAALALVPERGLLVAVLPIGPVGTTMVSDHLSPEETFVTSPTRS